MSKILANEIANYGDNAPIDLKEGLNIPAGKPLQAAGSAGSSGQILSSTGTSISWITPFDGSYNSLTNRPTIPAAQINSDWNASSGVAVILNKPSVPPLPSVTTAAASGGGTLAYNSGNGQFTFAPADLSSASNWDTAYGWGDHSAAGYLTAEADTLGTVVGRGNTTGGDIRFGDAQKAYFGDSNDLEIYHGGSLDNHAYVTSTNGNLYLKSASNGAVHLVGYNKTNLIVQSTSVQLFYDTSLKLETAPGGVTITGDIALGSGNLTTTGKLLYANNYDNLGDLPGASTYHGMFAHVHGTGKGYFSHDNVTSIAVTVGADSVAGQATGVFYFNGVEKPGSFILRRGVAYTFDQSDSSNATYGGVHHPLMVSATLDGELNGGSHYMMGITYKLDGVVRTMAEYVSGFVAATTRTVEWTPVANAPDTLYYWCHFHTGQGNSFSIGDGSWVQLLDTNSSLTDLAGVDLSTPPATGQVLKFDGSNWVASNDLTGGGGGGLALTDLSATNASASGGGSLAYNSGTGAFTFTPPDLSSYLTTETDPVFTASDAAAVTAAGIANWNSAYSWGNHAAQGYLVGYGGVSNHTDVNITGVQNGQLLQYNGSNWVNITPSYLTSYTETDTLDSVLARGDNSARNLHVTEGGELRLGSTTSADYGQIWLSSNTMYVRNTLSTGAGGDIYYQSRTGHHFYSGGTAAGNNCLSLTGSGICTLKYLGSDRLTTTASGVTVGGSVTATSFVKSGGTSSQYLMADGSVTTGGGGGGGASVTISDTAPAASAGDLWWESDTGRLKIYYQDTDSSQWVDTSPPLRFDNIDDIVTANGFKFRTNPSSPPAGTLGELRQINGKPYFYDGTTWQEFIFANAAVTTIPAETDWDQVLIRSNFDNDVNDFKFSAIGNTQQINSITPSSLVASPSVFGTNSLRCNGNGVRYPHRSEYSFTGTWTIEFWIYFDSANISSGVNNGEQEIITKSQAGTTSGSWTFYTNSDAFGNRSWRFKYHDVATNQANSHIVENLAGVTWGPKYLNTWVHIALTRDSNGALHLYTNGTESSSTSGGSTFANDINNSSHDVYIGCGPSTTSNTFDGYIDDVRITKDVRYVSEGQHQTQVFTPPTSAHPISGSTTTFTPPPTSKAGEIALGASPTWTGTLGVTVTQQSSGNYRMSFTNPFANASDYYVIANHLDGSGPVDLVSVRSAGHVDFAVTQSGSNVDTGSISVQVIAH